MDPDPRNKARKELRLPEAMMQDIGMREEVSAAIEAAETQDEARDAVAKILGAGEVRDRAILDMQARRWTQGEQRKITDHLATLRTELEPA